MVRFSDEQHIGAEAPLTPQLHQDPMGRISIRHYESISAVNSEDWGRLVTSTAFTSYAWLQAIEQHSVEPRLMQLLLAYTADKLAGAMILELATNQNHQNGVARIMLGGNRHLLGLMGKHFVPHLAAGTPCGYGGQLLFAEGVDANLRSQIADSLISAAEALSKSLRSPLWFTGVLATDQILLKTLRRAGYLSARYLPLAQMKIDWRTCDEYLAWQRRRSRNVLKDIRRERNRCQAAGVVLEEPADISGLDGVFVDMANQTFRKHGGLAFPFRPGFFTTLESQLRDSFMVCTANRDTETLGFITMLSDGDTAWADSYGLDYDHADSAFVYFILAYHWPIQKAIERGLRRIVFGRGQYALKLRRGCSLLDSYLLYKPSHPMSRMIYGGIMRKLDRHYTKQVSSESRS